MLEYSNRMHLCCVQLENVARVGPQSMNDGQGGDDSKVGYCSAAPYIKNISHITRL